MEHRKLTVKQRRFAQEYIKTGNATEAALRAGYSKSTAGAIGHENLKKPNIQAYLKKRMKEIEDESMADEIEVMQYLTRVLRGEELEQVAMWVGGGMQELHDRPPEIKDRIKAAELIGRRFAMFKDRLDVEGNVGAIIIDDIPRGEDD